MKDAFHGSAHPVHGLATAHRESAPTLISPYRGSSKHSPRRGTAHTAPTWIRRAGGHCFDRVPRIMLDVGRPGPGVPCWSGRADRWAHYTVPVAYKLRYDTDVRPAMPGNPVSLSTLVAVAKARAAFADHHTGRDCRPTNARLAAITGLSVRTIQRASTALRLLGVATEVIRGRLRTRAERLASWRVGDRGRGWASVWALHDSRIRALSPHPEGSHLVQKTSPKDVLTTTHRRKSAGSTTAPRRRTCRDGRSLALANRWVCDPQSPPWARRYRTGTPWARILAGPAHHGWTPRDLNQLIRDWIGTGHWIPDRPHKPIGLLGAMLCAQQPDDRPAAADVAREEAELAAARERVKWQLAERDANRAAREAGRAVLGGPGHRAARQVLAEIAERTRHRHHSSLGESGTP